MKQSSAKLTKLCSQGISNSIDQVQHKICYQFDNWTVCLAVVTEQQHHQVIEKQIFT